MYGTIVHIETNKGEQQLEKLTLNVENGIAWVTINRPEKRNAIDFDVIQMLDTFLDEIETNNEAKLLVITGAGDKAFCSGGDLSAFHGLKTSEQAFEMLYSMGRVLYRLCTFEKPTVALLNGTAVGGGCEIATACDFRLASENAKLGFIQGSLGITTGWGGGTMLYERLESPHAMHLLMTSKLITASEGKKIGYIQHTFTPVCLKEQAVEYLKPYTSQHLTVLRAYKQAFVEKLLESNLKARMRKEMERCAHLWDSKEHHEAVDRFLEKKKS